MATRKNGGANGGANTSAPGKPVLVDVVDGIAWVTLNRPEKRNAISPQLSTEMIATLDALEGRADVGVVILTGAGKQVIDMDWDGSENYLFAKIDQMRFLDPEQGRERAMRQFLDEKTYRPGLGNYKRDG